MPDTRESWFRATWFGWLPIHRTGWILTLGAAALVIILAAGGMIFARAPGGASILPAVMIIGAIIVIALFGVGLTRTQWGRGDRNDRP